MNAADGKSAIDTVITIDIAIVTAVALETETQTATEIVTVIAIVPPGTVLTAASPHAIATAAKIPPPLPRNPRQHRPLLPRPLRLPHLLMRNLWRKQRWSSC